MRTIRFVSLLAATAAVTCSVARPATTVPERSSPTPAHPAVAPVRACCAAAPVRDACGATEAKAAPLSSRSIYQVEGNWTDDGGAPFRLAQLRGEPVVLAMFFAHCEYACPLLVNDMRRLRTTLPPAVRARTRFVLVSFDPVRDTAPALRTYRERMQLDAGWTLLTGDSDEVQELAMVLGVKYRQDARGQFSHSNLITVLDSQGVVAHQRTGLQGEVLTAAQAVALAAR